MKKSKILLLIIVITALFLVAIKFTPPELTAVVFLVFFLISLSLLLYRILPKSTDNEKTERIKTMIIVTGLFVTILGWLVNGHINTAQGIEQKKKDLRVKYLLDAYFRLENSDQRTHDGLKISEYIYKKYGESALTSIQLLGDPETVKLANKYITSNGTDYFSDLLQALRNDLREELNIPKLPITTILDSSYHPSSWRIISLKGYTFADTITASEHVQLLIKLNELNK